MKDSFPFKDKARASTSPHLWHLSIKLFMFLSVLTLASACQMLDDMEDIKKDKVAKPALELVAENLTAPVMLTEIPDGSGNLVVLEQPGVIRVINSEGNLLEEPFLDIRDRVVELMDYDERGLLGIAFHPDYASNGRFFLYYSAPLRPEGPDGWDHTSHISEFSVSVNPLKADKNSEKVLLYVDQPQFNHNGGTVAFGPVDGYLYVSTGDGGGRDDEGGNPFTSPPQGTPVFGHVDDWYERNDGGNGQDITANLLGDILRIDVDGGEPYGIPSDNPFVGEEGLDEIYAYGFRNPYRFSFDMGGIHALYSQDAGQEMREEVNLIVKGGNYGWNVKEGTLCFDSENPENPYENCPRVDPRGHPLIDPVIQFVNAKQPGGVGLVVVGGYVYRGTEIPQWDGKYIFGTWSTSHEVPNGLVFVSAPELVGLWDFEEVNFANKLFGDLNAYLLGFGQDSKGEVYVLSADEPWPHGNSGKVHKIIASDKEQQEASVMGSGLFDRIFSRTASLLTVFKSIFLS